MKLNAYILQNELSGSAERNGGSSDIRSYDRQYQINSDHLSRLLVSYTIYYPGIPLYDDTLYLLPQNTYPDKSSDNIVFICLGHKGEFPLSECCDYIFLEEKLPLNALLPELDRIFQKYSDWERSLAFSVSGKSSISELCRISLPVFNNPIMVHNREYELFAYAESMNAAFGYTLLQQNTNYLNEAVTKDLFLRPDYLTAMTYTTPHYWLDTDDTLLSIYMNIFDESKEYWGRIVIDGSSVPLTKGHLALLPVLTDAVRKLALRQSPMKPNPLNLFKESALQYLQSPYSFHPEKLSMAMHMAGWHRHDGFFCMCLETVSISYKLNSAAYESMLFDHKLHGYLSLEWDNRLILICNLRLSSGDRDGECADMAYIVRENLFQCGISTVFGDFMDFSDYYLQALAALKTGLKTSLTKWIFKFEDYALQHILFQGSDSLPFKVLVPECIFHLIRYDQEHDTSYYKTLQNYVEYDAHTAKAIDNLYIHRNTFKSRMDKIREFVDINLEDYEERMYLSIIFRILDTHPDLLEFQNERNRF